MFVGNSPDADKIYQQYLAYYATCNNYAGAIASLPNYWQSPQVQADRATIIAAQQQLGPIEQKDYADNNATLASFENDCAPLLAKINAAYNDAMGQGSNIQFKIQQDYSNAQTIVGNFTTKLAQDQSTLNCIPALQNALNGLQTQINALPPGPKRDKAQQDLNTALSELMVLQTAVNTATPQFSALQNQQASINALLNILSGLAAKQNPTQQDLQKAQTALSILQRAFGDLTTFENSFLSAVNANLSIINTDIQAVQTDLNPTPPPPNKKVEHSTWMITWDSWSFPIPQGVNLVNLFVSRLDVVNGVPTIDGLGNMTLDKLDAFVKACQSNQPPINVKVSIGGGGGSYDNCWDLLTPDNVNAFAQGLVDFCHAHGLAGIDFDYEEYKSADQETLVGTLIKQFKTLDPSLQASLCTNAGFGTSYPWQAVVKNILDATVDGTGKSPLDRLYIMSYYEPLDQEEPWLLGWAAWANETYGLQAKQITVGIDAFDAHAYDIGAFSQWASSQGFSTGYWAWDPAYPDTSNAATTEILNNYKTSPAEKLKQFFIKEIFEPLSDIIMPIDV